MEPTALSLIPALVTIILAFATRRVLPALFLGIVSGGLVMWTQTGNIHDANIVSRFFLPALSTESYASILLIYLWCLGGLMGMWEKTGGALHFAAVVGDRVVRGPRSALFFAWMLGCIFHQGGTVSTVLTGTTVRPIADQHRVSHEELAYVVDSTGSPVATVIPFNAWPGFIAALLVGTVPFIPDLAAATRFFFSSVLYNFYGLFALLLTALTALGVMPWVGRRMAAARDRARETGALDGPDARPMLPTQDVDTDPTNNWAPGYTPSLLDFGVPIAVLISLAVGPYVLFGESYINEAFLACTLSSMAVAAARGMAIGDILDGFVDGCKTMTLGSVILGLAVTIGLVSKELQTAVYLVDTFGTALPAAVLPGLLAGLCMLSAFTTGTSWGTYAVVFPIAMPLAYAINPDPLFIQICFGAVLGGAVFGDQCSPISDTTILSAMFTGCDLMDHVRTQLPLSLLASGLGIAVSTILVALLL